MTADGEVQQGATARTFAAEAPRVSDDWPLGGLVEDVAPALAEATARNEPCVLITLARVEGHAPRRAGAQMLVRPNGEHLGFVAGGCVEAAVAAEAMRLFDGPARRFVAFGAGSPFVDVRLPCGSRLDLMMERVAPGDPAVARLVQARRERRDVLWLSRADKPYRVCIEPSVGLTNLPPGFGAAIRMAAHAHGPDAGGYTGEAEALVVWRRYAPPPRLVLIGGDPVVLALARLAQTAGWEVVVDRPRGPEAPPPGFGFAYDRRSVEAVTPELDLDRWTAVVAATHDLDLDHAALSAALKAPCFYVGALGSRSRLGERLKRLARDGLTDSAVHRLHSPAGLDIAAAAPFEIALAILAEASGQWRRPPH
jgi:xanthine dehydrogenase accessory factor